MGASLDSRVITEKMINIDKDSEDKTSYTNQLDNMRPHDFSKMQQQAMLSTRPVH